MNYFQSLIRTKIAKLLEDERAQIRSASQTKIERIIDKLLEVEASLDSSSSKAKINQAIKKLQAGNLYDYNLDSTKHHKADFFSILIASTAAANEGITTIRRNKSNENLRKSSNLEDEGPPMDRRGKKLMTAHILPCPSIAPKVKNSTINLNLNRLKIAEVLLPESNPIPNKRFLLDRKTFDHEISKVPNLKDSSIRAKGRSKQIAFDGDQNKSISGGANPISIPRRKNYKSSVSYIFSRMANSLEINLNAYDANLLKGIQSFDFDVFRFIGTVGRDRAFHLIFKYVLASSAAEQYKFLDEAKLSHFLEDIYIGYYKHVHYHNDIHAIDLCQTLFSWLINSKFPSSIKLNSLDLMSFYTAALVHDYKHPGTNNTYQMNFLSPIALTYNDVSILENFHISESLKVLYKNENNFLSEYKPNEQKQMRKRMIDTVLATDMAHHAKVFSSIKTKLRLVDVRQGINVELMVDGSSERKLYEDQQELLNLVVHLGDLSHNTKAFELSYNWTMLLHREFFEQGDKERMANKPISFLCDRETTDIENGQIGFLKGLIWPSFEILVDIIPEISYTLDNINLNIHSWKVAQSRREAVKEE